MKKYSETFRKSAVQMVLEYQDRYRSQWAAIESVAGKLGCSAQSVSRWMRADSLDQSMRTERDPIAALAQEIQELRQANAVLRATFNDRSPS